jgi:hypothetical protein
MNERDMIIKTRIPCKSDGTNVGGSRLYIIE